MQKKTKIYIEQPLGRFLSHTGRSFLSLLNTKLSHLDIDRSYYALLLIQAGEDGITQQDLAGLMDTDKVSVVRIIDYLSAKGYVKRAKNTSDRRKYSLMLTDKAKKAIPQIKNSLNEVTNIAFKGLNQYQIKEFYKTLNTIKNNLNESNSCL